jgi:hypothetical protein
VIATNIKVSFNIALCFVIIFFAGAFAQAAPASSLVRLDSPVGQSLLASSDNRDFWRLMSYFTYQKKRYYCGVASAVMVLNAGHVPAPATPELSPFRLFTQDNFFTPKVTQFIAPELATSSGITFKELAAAIASFSSVSTERVYANDLSLTAFREQLKDLLNKDNYFVIAFYDRSKLGQKHGAHFSPIAAYDSASDRFLILETARFDSPLFG